MTRTRLYLLAFFAAAVVTAALVALVDRALAASAPAAPVAVEAEDTLTMQAVMRYRQCQPHHWRYVMLRQ